LIRKPPFPAQIVSVEGDVCELSALLDNKDYLGLKIPGYGR